MAPYWLLRAFGKTLNINHVTTMGLERAFKKHPNPTVRELIETYKEGAVCRAISSNGF
jgi:hypothetical protein